MLMAAPCGGRCETLPSHAVGTNRSPTPREPCDERYYTSDCPVELAAGLVGSRSSSPPRGRRPWPDLVLAARDGGFRQKLRARMPSLRDAVLVSLMAYAGLRPGEAFALTFGSVGNLLVIDSRSATARCARRRPDGVAQSTSSRRFATT